ncbi:hypothetical protein E4L96_20085 [Massilia arenosa]|uniref:Uncharacterized protein n=1 Tax=Zemynaea arenosa TaxID=2561931 RepID=A0A4Y9S1H4_9BURK|nr:hypothetical protein [Massilia arenosa]TFW13398.1 hypothetical protein E4L96_20085 [Massilia arenosa]
MTVWRTILISILLATGDAQATALRSDRPTDDSVCDLGSNTSLALMKIRSVPWHTREIDKVHERMLVSWVVHQCHDGQILIIDGANGDDWEHRYAESSALRLCTGADIRQFSKGSSQYPQAFELRCLIRKITSARNWSENQDRLESLDAMIASRAGVLPEGEAVHRSDATNVVDKAADRCSGKSKLASILFGGGTCKTK